ncbi:MAG: transcription antitermination factor NusB [Spirochaetia bacterium]|uniref:Transcription antitermination protein NusB n=1 Tax=Candidatus Treponema excrementipullorum TaxID=2838768 RepID=A0A9E2NZ00_9SPIR|nr:transcription antitermination factor NusB [Candidatus Treponema excrementipullorum]MCI6954403.1 transcription antitermination factor NusB [Spirochaetia bacterium]
MARRKSRILAFQALFSWDMGNKNLDDLFLFPWAGDSKILSDQESLTFAKLLIAGTVEHIQEIDKLIEKHLENTWSIERINKVDLAILRISVYPLLYQKDIHPTIVINEAVDISKEFGSDDSYKFINAVLDNVRKDLEA